MKRITVKKNPTLEPLKYTVLLRESSEALCGIQITIAPIKKIYRILWYDMYTMGKPLFYISPDENVIYMGSKNKGPIWFRIDKPIKDMLIESKTMRILETLLNSQDEPYLFLNNCLRI